jgi:hypothetical protein
LNRNLIRPDNPAAALRSRSGAADADIVLSPSVRSILGDGELSPLRRTAVATSRQPRCRHSYYGRHSYYSSLRNAVSIGNRKHSESVYTLFAVGSYSSDCALLASCVKRDP